MHTLWPFKTRFAASSTMFVRANRPSFHSAEIEEKIQLQEYPAIPNKTVW
jgi:hypothetical protein